MLLRSLRFQATVGFRQREEEKTCVNNSLAYHRSVVLKVRLEDRNIAEKHRKTLTGPHAGGLLYVPATEADDNGDDLNRDLLATLNSACFRRKSREVQVDNHYDHINR